MARRHYTEAELLAILEKGLSDVEDLDDSDSDDEIMLPRERRIGDPDPDPAEVLEEHCDTQENQVSEISEFDSMDDTGYTTTMKKAIRWKKDVTYVSRTLPIKGCSGNSNENRIPSILLTISNDIYPTVCLKT